MSDLSKLGRDDLNTVAAALGIEVPDKLANKDEVVDAILGVKARLDEALAVPPEPEKARREIGRVNDATGAWWCPFCDRSHESRQRDCDGCGAVRDGDEAVITRSLL